MSLTSSVDRDLHRGILLDLAYSIWGACLYALTQSIQAV